MSKKELIAEIRCNCKGKCNRRLQCIAEVKAAKARDIKQEESLTQCRLHTDLFEAE